MTPAQAARLAAARRIAMLPTPIRIVLDDYAALAGALGDLALLPGLRQQAADRDAAIAAQVQVIARLEADLAERKAAWAISAPIRATVTRAGSGFGSARIA